MLMLEALQDFPKGKKGYYLWGDPTAIRVLRKKFFPDAGHADTVEQVASAAPGVIMITPNTEGTIHDMLEYLSMPKSDRTYVYSFPDGESSGVKKPIIDGAFKKLKLPRIDCTDPDTPKDKRVAVEFLVRYLKVSEGTAWQIGKRTQWKLATILNVVYSWTRLTTAKLADSQVQRLIETLLPSDPVEIFINNVVEKKFHKIDLTTLSDDDTEASFQQLSQVVDKLRILKGAMVEVSSPGMLAERTGLTQDELKRYTPLVKGIKSAELARWGDALQWSHTRKDKPKVLHTLVSLMSVGG